MDPGGASWILMNPDGSWDPPGSAFCPLILAITKIENLFVFND